ncbi:hypothetical protein [Candidatus Leptofilum sp.]|uniref:hypothetical protein n=1 Tax=Candidatus Leptofilum sp. TaxID=3241576 RepID=UPI003B58C4CC
MVRSRLIFVFLILAYLGVTPAGVYTCACLVPAQPVMQQVVVDGLPEQSSVSDTAVATLITFFSLAFLVTVAFLLAAHRCGFRRWQSQWHLPLLFSEPPPTPPPHVAQILF